MKYRKASSVLCPKCHAPALGLMDWGLLWMFIRQPGRDEFATYCKACKFRIYVTRSSVGTVPGRLAADKSGEGVVDGLRTRSDATQGP